MNTVLQNLTTEAMRLRHLLEELLAHLSIKRWHEPAMSGVVYLGGHFAWQPLGDVGRQLQAKTLEEYRRFYSVLRTLLREQPDDTVSKLEEAKTRIEEVIQQRVPLFGADSKSYFDHAFKALESQVTLLNRLHGEDGKPAFVPDTNSLIFNPAIEKWQFDGATEFVIVLTPVVLSELDSLKINHRVDAVRDKAEKVIRQIKEYRRRAAGARLAAGVVLVAGVSEIVAVATEPQMEKSLPWLDPTNNDDRILAAVIEVMRTRPRSPVLLVTRDINLQNKAEFANVPFVEPPDQV